MGKFDCRVFMASVAREAGGAAGIGWGNPRRLLRLTGNEFIRQSYRAILKREADPAGVAGYGSLANRPLGRLYILAALYVSPENPRIPTYVAELRTRFGRVLKIFGKNKK